MRRVVSSCVGVNMMPYRSVTPSRAFTEKGVGARHPVAVRREMSARSSVMMTRPVICRSTVTGGVVVVE
jgi:hypothetical protein